MQIDGRRNKQTHALINYAAFTSDGSYAVIGTQEGFRVYSVDPLAKIITREHILHVESEDLLDQPGGISCLHILDGSNLFAIVSGGRLPK